MKRQQVLTEDLVREIVKEELNNHDEIHDQELERRIRDPLMEKLDALLKEIRDSRDEQILLSGKQAEHSDELEDHDGRIKKLEKIVFKN